MVTRSSSSGDVFDSTLDPDTRRNQNSSGGNPNPSSRRNLFGRPLRGRAGLRRLLAGLFPEYKTVRRLPPWRGTVRPMFEVLEPRIMLSTVTWSNLAGGDWGVSRIAIRRGCFAVCLESAALRRARCRRRAARR